MPGLFDVELCENPEPRANVVLLVDTSGSMHGEPIAELNRGLVALKEQLGADHLARKRVEVAIIAFGGAPHIVQPFTTADRFVPPTLVAEGDTPLGEAVLMGIDQLAARKRELRQNGIQLYRPWMFLITDGYPNPTSAVEQAASRVHAAEAARELAFFAVGVDGADMATLAKIAPSTRPPLRLRGLAFVPLINWLSAGLLTVSRSRAGDAVKLESPAGWAVV